MVLMGIFAIKYNFVVASQIFPVLKDGLPSYTPTLMEFMLIAGIFSGCFLVHTIGERFLPLDENMKIYSKGGSTPD